MLNHQGGDISETVVALRDCLRGAAAAADADRWDDGDNITLSLAPQGYRGADSACSCVHTPLTILVRITTSGSE